MSSYYNVLTVIYKNMKIPDKVANVIFNDVESKKICTSTGRMKMNYGRINAAVRRRSKFPPFTGEIYNSRIANIEEHHALRFFE